MKKKLLMLALMLAALCALTCTLALAADTPEEPTLKIEAANLSFEDSTYILYAISHDGIPYDSIQMLFWTEPQDEYTIGTESYSKDYFATNVNVSGQNCTVFKNNELRAKNMADNVYARAYAKVGGKEYYSELSKYSILQYASNKLGKTGTATTNEALRNMLVEMLNYGASAQEHFNHNTQRPANGDFYQIKVEGGVLEDGFTKGLYLSSESATLSAAPTKNGFPFLGWKDSAGATVATTPTATLTGFSQNETYTATYEEPIPGELSYTLSSDGTYYIVSGIGGYTDAELVIPAKHNNLPVREIGAGAFSGASTITSLKLSTTIVSIGENAFDGCLQLEKVHFLGTRTEWNAVAIASGNEAVLSAHKEYESNRTEWMPF